MPRPPWPAVDYEVSKGGDSGSVWLNQSNNQAIGLHFAGETNPSPAAENAICSPMGPIATELNFSFLPVLCRPKIFDICDRWPWICEPRLRWPRFPFPDPGPLGRPGPLGGDLGALLGGNLGQQAPGAHSGCTCSGGTSEVDPYLLAQLLAAYLHDQA